MEKVIKTHAKKLSPCILVADDDITMRFLMRQTLETEGFEVIEACDGRECLALFNASKVDLLILDINMPELNGLAVCQAIRGLKAGKHIPILMVTGDDDFGSITESFKVGATSFLPKPVNWTLLPHHIRYLSRSAEALTKQIQAEQYAIKLGKVIDNSSNEIYLFELEDTSITQMNTSARVNLGYSEQEVLDLKFVNLSLSFQDEEFDEKINLLRQEKLKNIGLRAEFIRKDNSTYPVEIDIYYSSGGDELCFAIVQDVTERRRAEDNMHHMAYHDFLTGLPNRQLLTQQVADYVDEAIENDHRIAVLFIDLDNFKQVNDELGHDIGDQLLLKVSKSLLESVRDDDFLTTSNMIENNVVRLGGDEFVIVLSDLGPEVESNIVNVAQRIISVFNQSILLDKYTVRVTASIGIAVSAQDGSTLEKLLVNADIAMRQAKLLGKNKYYFCCEALKQNNIKLLQMEKALQKALDDDEFCLNFQPFYNLEDDSIIGAEALLRWDHAEEGVIPPNEFIPFSEECGLINDITLWVFRNACMEYSRLINEGFTPGLLSINISASDLEIDTLPESFYNIVNEFNLSPKNIFLEITEGTVMQNINDTEFTLQRLKERGFNLSIDDFGTGYSSLAYLKHYPFDNIKIDKTFVENIDSNDDSKVLMDGIITMIRALKFDSIVEGIETAAELDVIKVLNANVVQGYYICRPLPIDKYKEFLHQFKQSRLSDIQS